MPKREARNPASAKGDWYIDDRCINCAASREVAPGLIVERGGKSWFSLCPISAFSIVVCDDRPAALLQRPLVLQLDAIPGACRQRGQHEGSENRLPTF